MNGKNVRVLIALRKFGNGQTNHPQITQITQMKTTKQKAAMHKAAKQSSLLLSAS
jgi:hypothetical protein